MTKQYVFDLLVNNLDDHIGLVAYSFYKYEKADLAKSMRAAGKTENEIVLATASHHDNVSASDHLREKFREQSKTFFSLNDDQIIAEISQFYEIQHRDALTALDVEMAARASSYEKQISNLKRQHDAQIKKLERKYNNELDKKIKAESDICASWLRKVEAQRNSELGKAKVFGLWLLSGIPGAIATVILTVAVMSAVLMLKTTPEDKRKYVEQTASDVVDIFAPPTNPPALKNQ